LSSPEGSIDYNLTPFVPPPWEGEGEEIEKRGEAPLRHPKIKTILERGNATSLKRHFSAIALA
jgi:hypothetical protein